MQEMKNYDQANTYISMICNLYNVSEKAKETMHNGLEQIQQELGDYDVNDIKVAINRHYKYKSSKTRPNLHQVVAELTGVEKLEHYSNNDNSAYDKYDNLVNEFLNNYLNSNHRIEVLTTLGYSTELPKLCKNNTLNGYTEVNIMFANPIDRFMCQYIQIQANILAKTNISVGLDNEFSKIKPTAHQQASRYSCLLYYFKSKEFYETVKRIGAILILVPTDIQEHFYNK